MVAASFAAISQSTTIKEFETKNEDAGYNLFLYQSVIRMLNKDNNEDFNYLVQDLEYIKVLITDSTETAAVSDYKAMTLSISNEGYEELLMIDNKDMKASVYQIDNGNGVEFVAFLHSKDFGRTGAFEMKGNLNLKYLSAFESLDFAKLKEIAESQN